MKIYTGHFLRIQKHKIYNLIATNETDGVTTVNSHDKFPEIDKTKTMRVNFDDVKAKLPS